MYRPIPPSQAKLNRTTSFMGKGGVNLRDLPQALNIKYALDIQNYFITGEGGLKKRKGIKKKLEDTGDDGITMLEEWKKDIWIYGYNKTLKAFNAETETKTSIKTDFIEAGFSGDKAGNYFMVASPRDKIGRLSMTLDYDTQTADFTAGTILTGGTSGATATILEDDDSGATGTLTLGDIEGTFEDNEIIADNGGGSATADGTLDFTYTEISTAPKARGIKVIGSRCYAWDLEGHRDTVQYSDIATVINPPFNNWNVSTVPDQGGQLSYRGAGVANNILAYSKFIVVMAEKGWWSFDSKIIDSAGTLKKIDNFNMYRQDEIGASGAIMTDNGIYYVNRGGVHRLVQLQQENVDYSKQEVLSSELLGNTYFEDVDFSDVAMTYISDKSTLLISCRKNSAKNNYLIAFNTKLKSFSFFTGLSISTFMQNGDHVYGASSVSNKIYEMFTVDDDDGKDIWTRYYQEINVGDQNTRKQLLGQYIQGKLSKSSDIEINFDIYNGRGFKTLRKKAMHWKSDAVDNNIDEYGRSKYGEATYGGDSDVSGAIENYGGGRCRINDFQRIRVDITENSKHYHEINFFTLITREKTFIRKNNLTY